jgi:hypothetical protein
MSAEKPTREDFILEAQRLSNNGSQPVSRDFFRNNSPLKDRWAAYFPTFEALLDAANIKHARKVAQPAVKAAKVAPPPEEPREVYLRRDNSRLRNEVRKAHEEQGYWQEMTDAIVDAITGLDPLPPVEFESPMGAGSDMAACIKLSDWHIGEIIKPEETEGFGIYNWDIAQERMKYIAQKFLGWVDTHRTTFNIPNLYVFGEGDWVSGDIHEELRRTNEFPLPVQATQAGKLLAQTVSTFAPHFDKITLVEIGADNHGRLLQKPQSKQKSSNSMSHVVYEIANAYLQNHENIDIVTTEGMKHVVDMVGVKFLIEHGDTVKAWMGIPFYGLERERGREAIKRMQAMLDAWRQEMEDMAKLGFDYISCGHWHVPGIVSGNILINGSLSGTSEFDHGCGRHARPSQVSFLVHPEHKLFDWVAWTPPM